MAGLSIAGPIPVTGSWNAATNTPTLANGTGTAGALYRVSVGGTRNLGAGSVTYSAGEYITYRNGTWQKTTTAARGVESLIGVETRLLATGITAGTVSDRVEALATGPSGTKITKASVDALDAAYASASYATTQDALLIPTSARGVAGGVATLGADGKVPGAQVPAMGNGTFKGPWGATTVTTGTTGTTPLKIASWNIGVTAMTFRPLVYLQSFILVTGRGRPVIEVRAGDASQTTYASQTLVGSGFGRAYFDDYQAITVLPAAPTGTQSNGVQPSWGPGVDFRMSAWLYNGVDEGQVALNSNQLPNACVYLVAVGA